MNNCTEHNYIHIHTSNLKTINTIRMGRGYYNDIIIRGHIVTLACSKCGMTITRNAESHRFKRPSSGG